MLSNTTEQNHDILLAELNSLVGEWDYPVIQNWTMSAQSASFSVIRMYLISHLDIKEVLLTMQIAQSVLSFFHCSKNVTDKDDRCTKNIIIYGIEEINDEGSRCQKRVESVLEEIDKSHWFFSRDCVRIVPKKSDSKHPRPVKLSLSKSDDANQVLRNARKLHTKEGYRTICVSTLTEQYRKGQLTRGSLVYSKKSVDQSPIDLISSETFV